VKDAEHEEPVRRGTVYVAPPDTHTIVDRTRRLRLVRGAKVEFSRPAVDVLFTSVAQVYGASAIAAVLTGKLKDGAAGVRAIKRAGGRVLVQEPMTAREPSMPTEAIATGCADFILPLDILSSALVALVAVPGAADLLRVAPPPWALRSA
jgi:two-component system chemotaxis response regulator CheB